MEGKRIKKLSSSDIVENKLLYTSELVRISFGSFQEHQNIVFKKFVKKSQNLFMKEREFLDSYKVHHFPQCIIGMKGENYSYLVMEYCKGNDLKSYLNSHALIPLSTAKSLLQGLAESLNYLKKQNLIHTKLNSSKVLLTTLELEKASIKLSGISHIEAHPVSLSQRAYFESVYQAPELFKASTFGFKQNIWNFGVIAYEVLAGVLPFEAENIQQYSKELEDGIRWEENENLTDEVKEFLGMMLKNDPGQRADIEDIINSRFFHEDKRTDLEIYHSAIRKINSERFHEVYHEKEEVNVQAFTERHFENIQSSQIFENPVERLKNEFEEMKKMSFFSNYYTEENVGIFLVIRFYLKKKIEDFVKLIQVEISKVLPGSQELEEILAQAINLAPEQEFSSEESQKYLTELKNRELEIVSSLETLVESIEINRDSHDTILTSVKACLDLFPSNSTLKTLKSILDSFN